MRPLHAQGWLEGYLATQGAVAGTLHQPHADELQLVAAVNIPASVLAVVQRVPLGKGMAGLAWQRGEPVTTCDLERPSPDVRPGAAAVPARAAVALPLRDAHGRVIAILGVAYPDTRELSPDDCARLSAAAKEVPLA